MYMLTQTSVTTQGQMVTKRTSNTTKESRDSKKIKLSQREKKKRSELNIIILNM